MVQQGPSDSTSPPAEGRRLGGGAIASLTGVGLLVIFMIQNTQRVRLDFLFWTFTWRFGSSRWSRRCSGRWCGWDWA